MGRLTYCCPTHILLPFENGMNAFSITFDFSGSDHRSGLKVVGDSKYSGLWWSVQALGEGVISLGL